MYILELKHFMKLYLTKGISSFSFRQGVIPLL